MSDTQRRSKLKGDTVTRTYKIFRFDPHLRRRALLIRGEITVQVADSLCRQIIAEETKEFRKVIRLDAMNDFTDVSAVMDDVLEKCPYIEEDLIGHLMTAIEAIKRRKYNENGFVCHSGRSSSEDAIPTFPDYFEEDESLNGIDSDTDLRDISMESLDNYVELLYEQIPDKVKGARCIAKLAGTAENLPEIYEHESALNALFRTLREDYKKSLDLTTSILSISLSFANYRNFHPAFISNKICSLLMDIVEYELTRFDKWVDEIHFRKELAKNPQQTSTKIKIEYEKMKAKFAELTTRQDVLLCSGFNLIRLLSETPAFMKEIVRRGIVKLLISCLDRKNTELIITVVSFLKVMSAFKEANVQMGALDVIDSLQIMVEENSPKAVLAPLLGLLFNLSFNSRLRLKMLKCDLLSKTAALLNVEDIQPLCVPLLYNFSMDDRIRPKFAGTGTIGYILQLLAKTSEDSFDTTARALTLNLASSKRCCQIICGNGGLPVLLKLAFKHEDNLTMKIIRKLAEHEGPTKNIFLDLIPDIARAILNAPNKQFAIECIGTLGNLGIPDLDFKKLLEACDLIPWIKSILQVTPNSRRPPGEERGQTETATIEVVIFIGTCAGDADCACYLIQAELLELLYDLCSMSNNIDPDITVQILFAFYKFCEHEKPRRHIVEHTDIPQLIIDLLRDDSIAIREIAEAVLNTFTQLENDVEWKNRVTMEKFKAYNKAWVDEINRPSVGDNLTNQIPAYQKHQLDLFHPPPEFHEDEFEHPDSGRSKTSSSSTSDTLTLSETETEEETEDEEDVVEDVGVQPNMENLYGNGIPAHHSKSIFDRFEHQFRQERGVQEGYEYGISEEDDEGLDDNLSLLNGRGTSFENLSTNGKTSILSESLHRKSGKSARGQTQITNSNGTKGSLTGRDYQRKLESEPENGLTSRLPNNLKTEDYNNPSPTPRKNLSTKPVMSVEIKRKS